METTMTGNELADWLVNDQGCECEDAGECNICLIAARLRKLDHLAGKLTASEAKRKVLEMEVSLLQREVSREHTTLERLQDLVNDREVYLRTHREFDDKVRASTDTARALEGE